MEFVCVYSKCFSSEADDSSLGASQDCKGVGKSSECLSVRDAVGVGE